MKRPKDDRIVVTTDADWIPPGEKLLVDPDPSANLPDPDLPKRTRVVRKSPTSRSLTYLRKEGWHVAVVERHVSFQAGARGPGFKQDAFGFMDILAFAVEPPFGGGFLAVQTTSGTNVAARLDKIKGKPQADTDRARAAALDTYRAARDWLIAGGRIEVHGWSKSRKSGLYTIRIVPVRLTDLPGEEPDVAW